MTDKQKADLFCQLYAEISRVDRTSEDKRVNREAAKTLKSDCNCNKEGACSVFTLRQVNLAIKNLKKGKSPGPDGVGNEMLKQLPDPALKALLALFNRSWQEGKTPSAWRVATIIPMYKGKGKAVDSPKSYRPVALTSCLAKLMERLVSSRLIHLLEAGNKLAPCQAGFRKGRSTEEQLARITQNIFDGLEDQAPRRSVLVLLDRLRQSVEERHVHETGRPRGPRVHDTVDQRVPDRQESAHELEEHPKPPPCVQRRPPPGLCAHPDPLAVLLQRPPLSRPGDRPQCRT